MRPPRPIERRLARWRRVRPPRCPRGWSTGLPDFVGIGAQRAGTTWWHSLLTEHPAIVGPRVKELHFFEPRMRELDPAVVARDYARYLPRPPGSMIGEWTPSYMYADHVVPLLASIVPSARFLVLLRDPVERYGSAITRRPDMPSAAYARGLYAAQLRRVLEYLPRDQLLVQQYERCLREPAGELARTLRFLGVPDDVAPERFDRGGARSFGGGTGLEERRRSRLIQRYEEDVRELEELGFEIDLSLWPNFADLSR